MFDIAPSEFLLVAVIALVVIGPKDLPKALRLAGYWVGKARGVARQFRSGFDNMVREAELADMEKKWAAENERIMREHGAGTDSAPSSAAADRNGGTGDAPSAAASEALAANRTGDEADLFSRPVMVDKPVVAPADGPPAADSKAPS